MYANIQWRTETDVYRLAMFSPVMKAAVTFAWDVFDIYFCIILIYLHSFLCAYTDGQFRLNVFKLVVVSYSYTL